MSLTASETDNMQVKINSSDKQSKNGDEQIEGMGISDGPEFTDPAILAVREITKIRYTKEQLVNLKNVPLSKKKPDFLESTEGLPWIFGSERWPFDRKKSGSNEPSDNSTGSNNNNGNSSEHRRRNSGDPRERIRKENDGIVLSPQRRSFNSGCFVPASRIEPTARNNRPHSPLGPKTDGSHIGVREIQPSTRRIGSGRILRANGDFNEKSEGAENENYGNGFSRGPRGPNNNDEKYERRNFGRDFDMGRDRERENPKESRRSGRAFDRRKMSENREQEEPEWFSSGPISQNDTIELRGFDDADKPGRKKISPSQMKRAKEWSKKKEELQTTTQTKGDNEKLTTDRTTVSETKVVVEVSDIGDEKDAGKEKESEAKNKTTEGDPNCKVSSMLSDQSLNFDDILKCDKLPGLLSNIEIEYDGNTSKSRFSRWFKQESPEKQESRRSSLHEDSIIKNLLNDIGETNVVTNSVPGDSEAYFAPISPAGNNLGGVIGTGKRETSNSNMKRTINLMEMLQIDNQPNMQNVKQPLIGKILSLDELEAKIRKNAESAGVSQKPPSKPDEEMSAAFKKLLSQAQASSGHSNGPMNKAQPMSLLEMLKDSQQQDEAARLSAAGLLMGPTSPHHHNPQQPPHFTNDMAHHMQAVQQLKQQKQQMEMFNKLINSTTSINHHQMRTSPSLHDIGLQQQTRELLNRPEAQAILQGLKRGEITTQHLYQQLANPALQHRHREMLSTILKIQNNTATTPGYGPSPRVSPVPPHHHHIFQQQQPQQLRVSPLPPNAMQQRIPSPRELQVHTQNILQRALIKKKLEEQQENYRKKQEMAFTPTSVLRKMTAEKDESKENKISVEKMQTGRPLTGMRPQPPQPQTNPQWYGGNLKQPGRPIVKANNYQTQTPEQFFSQHQQHQQQQQQRLFNQFQQQQQLSSQQMQQRKTSTSNQFGGSSQPPTSSGGQQFNQSSQFHLSNQQFGQQLTQQQLRAQHQHRPNNSQNPNSSQQTHHQQSQPQQGFQQQQQSAGVWPQIINNTQQPQRTNRNSNPTTRADNDLSQTTNQLAQWFSSDLLERARGGELPSTAGLAQHVISLEEIERQTAPPVHN